MNELIYMVNVNNFSLILNKMVTNQFIVVHLKRIGTKKSEFFAITSFKKYKSRPKTSKHLTLNCPHSCKYVTTKTHIHIHIFILMFTINLPHLTKSTPRHKHNKLCCMMMWLCRIKDAIYLGPIHNKMQKNVQEREVIHLLIMHIGCPNILNLSSLLFFIIINCKTIQNI